MIRSEVAAAEQNINLMYPVGVHHSERASASLWACARASRVMAELYLEAKVSQALLPEESTRPFL